MPKPAVHRFRREQLFLALLGGDLLGVIFERALVRELTGNLVLHWFVGLDLD